MFNNFFFGNRALYEVRWKNTVQLDSPQVTIRRTRFACWITKATHTYTHIFKICNTYLFSMATMVSQTRLNVTLCLHCLSCLLQRKTDRGCNQSVIWTVVIARIVWKWRRLLRERHVLYFNRKSTVFSKNSNVVTAWKQFYDVLKFTRIGAHSCSSYVTTWS